MFFSPFGIHSATDKQNAPRRHSEWARRHPLVIDLLLSAGREGKRLTRLAQLFPPRSPGISAGPLHRSALCYYAVVRFCLTEPLSVHIIVGTKKTWLRRTLASRFFGENREPARNRVDAGNIEV